MSRKFYPVIESKKKLKTVETCSECGSRGEGFYRVEIQWTFMRGDDEIVIMCEECLKKFEAERNQKFQEHLDRVERAINRQEKKKQNLFNRISRNYQVRKLTDYQWRINGVLDVYPKGHKYHDLKQNKRGSFGNIHKFLKTFFNEKS